MRLNLLFLVFPVLAVANELPLAKSCDERLCNLPDCRCSSTNIPGGLLPRNTPQFVTVTFDDNINVRNIQTYREVLYARRNSNNCPAGTTFYINHEYTDYSLVNELYNQGFEIALHSISHQTPPSYWAEASYDDMKKEIADQRAQISHFASIPSENIYGVRLPFLQMAGNSSFQVMSDYGIVYDASWPTVRFRNPGLWPYTLDYESTQDCIIPPCPTASIPKTWVNPMVAWTDLQGVTCVMVDTCFHVPDKEDEEGWYQFIVRNFETHYSGNRAPFGFYIHEWYLSSNPAIKAALVRFLNLVNSLNDAFMVNSHEVIEWVKNPIPVPQYRAKACRTWQPTQCSVKSCGPIFSQHNEMNYWMTICAACPRVYPWLGNPLGQ